MTRRYPTVCPKGSWFADPNAIKHDVLIGRTRVFLAGPMSGQWRFNHPHFDLYATELSNWYEVANPAEHDREMHPDIATWPDYSWGDTEAAADMGFDLEEAKWWCLQKVLSADIVALLPGWEQSVGARLEVEVARTIGIPTVGVTALIDKEWTWRAPE